MQCFLEGRLCSFAASLLLLLRTNFEEEGGNGDSSKVYMGLVLLQMRGGTAVRESQYVTLFYISLDFFSTSFEVS